ncbi:unnamed protein product [Paramecium pentaurelia]|uniref:Uncharacterized protein n=1 Tax=Paramecium pentaurelia TaxID=43138 RepID=A0A8S1YGM5_9CILI|nr:unnamed protein product [Paramecium pentaurelia]
MIEMLLKENNQDQDCLKFLLNVFFKYLENYNQIENLSPFEKKEDTFQVIINSITHLIKTIKEQDINSVNYYTKIYTETRYQFIKKISQQEVRIQFLKFLVHLNKIDNHFIISGSNALNILVDLKNQILKISELQILLYLYQFCKTQVRLFVIGKNQKQTIYINQMVILVMYNQSITLSVYGIQQKAQIGWSYQLCLVSFDDNSILLWDVTTEQQKAKLDGHSSAIMSVCFFPDGNTLVSCSRDNSIRLWDFKTGQQKAKLDSHTNRVNSVCFSLDGNTLASGSNDKSIRLWNVKAGQEIQSSDNRYNDILENCKISLLQNNPITVITNIPILCISQTPIFKAKGALVLKGEFIIQQSFDLRLVLKSRGCCILESSMKKCHIMIFQNIKNIIKVISYYFFRVMMCF